ncbi:MAG TPA: GNAT family N-acetyltransferase [Thermoplasmata archaeon]|nr:GNAT family N-acetyltransferase [Thermoplasmata archaeon]
MVTDPIPGRASPSTLQLIPSVEAVRAVELPDLSDFFNPFLRSFMEATCRVGGEVVVARGPTGVEGCSLYHPAEQLVSLFTRRPAVAMSLLERRSRVEVFSELPLGPGAEVYYVYEADLGASGASHRFAHTVREVRPEDRAPLLSLLRELYGRVDEEWFRPIPAPPEKGFAIEVDGRIAGAGWVSLVGGHARFHTLSVRPRCRRLGVGTDLWHARAQYARARGAQKALMEVSENNRASQAIATAGGMRRVGQMYRAYRP